MAKPNGWFYRKKARKGNPDLVANMLNEYAEGSFRNLPMWRIGYLCAMRDVGLLTWKQWSVLILHEREKL